MNILAVDTAGKTAGVALLQDDRLLYEVYLDAGMTHSETLMPMIDTCLKMCGMTCADIDLYGVNAGPGSFTGLRIGLAAVKGLAFPRETLCAPVSTLEALAAAHTGEGTSSKKRPTPVLRGASFSTPLPALKSFAEGNKPMFVWYLSLHPLGRQKAFRAESAIVLALQL